MERTYVMAGAPRRPWAHTPTRAVYRMVCCSSRVRRHRPGDRAAGQRWHRGADRTRLCNLGLVLEAAGSSWREVVKVNVFLVDMDDFAAMNAVYARYFDGQYPARTTVAVAGLPLRGRVEIELQAMCRVGNPNARPPRYARSRDRRRAREALPIGY